MIVLEWNKEWNTFCKSNDNRKERKEKMYIYFTYLARGPPLLAFELSSFSTITTFPFLAASRNSWSFPMTKSSFTKHKPQNYGTFAQILQDTNTQTLTKDCLSLLSSKSLSRHWEMLLWGSAVCVLVITSSAIRPSIRDQGREIKDDAEKFSGSCNSNVNLQCPVP